VVVDGHMEIVVANPFSAVSAGLAELGTMPPPPAPRADPTQLLNVHMEELTRALSLITHHGPGRAVDEVEAGDPGPAQHSIDRRAGSTQPIGQTVPSMKGCKSRGNNGLHRVGIKAVWTVPWGRRTILKAR
jgi:hypothetical protein